MPAGEHIARTGKSGLDLICQEQNIVFCTDLSDFLKPAIRRDDDTSLALDRFSQESDGIRCDGITECFRIAIRDRYETRTVRTVAVSGQRVSRKTDDRDRTPVKVAGTGDDLLSAVLNTLDAAIMATG